ncbi:GNAT family N-acetyltransferase [Desulfitobacterium hafniense]|uniref:GNAT family N-acetyltransferase n=1 Tax=Desulfitobacterium hafniense TaxID=49338 RepID=UPI000361EB7D|nr:GNAT family N-acetyltransferase [Desulfitobacterium hafniense]
MYIETERLILRKPVIEDFAVYWLMKNDPMATMYTGGITPYTYEERYKMFQEEWVDSGQNSEFTVIEKESTMYIGYCGIRYCDVMGENELLYGLCPNSWNKGYGYEAAKAVLDYGFSVLKLACIAAAVNPQNTYSEKILAKLGMNYASELAMPGMEKLRKYVLNVEQYNLLGV